MQEIDQTISITVTKEQENQLLKLVEYSGFSWITNMVTDSQRVVIYRFPDHIMEINILRSHESFEITKVRVSDNCRITTLDCLSRWINLNRWIR